MFSLCIPTLDRYDDFLQFHLPKYLEYAAISEIVVVDENGRDLQKIQQHLTHPKLKLYQNPQRLGPFLNKYKACWLASNPWIALLDSDNFAEEDYFLHAQAYLQHHQGGSPTTVLLPSFAKPDFDYRHLAGQIITRDSIKTVLNPAVKHNETMMNTGNYILNKYLITHLDLSAEISNIAQSASCDVILFNTLLLEQFEVAFHVVENLSYFHNIHHSSVYLNTYWLHAEFNEQVYQRFRRWLA